MSAWYKAKIKSICNGTGINNLTNENFNQVLLPVPPEQYIRLFNSLVSSSFDRIGENEMQTEMLGKQRDDLLPLVMNGQVSVRRLNNHFAERNRMLSSAFSKLRMYERRINSKNRGGDGWFPLRRRNAAVAKCGSDGAGRLYGWTDIG